MIDMGKEQLITLSAAAKLRPASRSNRPTHISTLYRWATRGLRGVRLEILRLGGVTYTSRESLQRFAEKLTSTVTGTTPVIVEQLSDDTTDAALDEFGI